ncbi:MAG TPA: hypothetical protein VK158_00380 [Acidobacteriota bacterium]|nr:hypothetical protein [Acidobacteriota bacterium]
MVNYKKAFFLTFIAILLVAMFLLYYEIASIKDDKPIDYSSSVRSRTLNNFVRDLEEFHLRNILTLATHRALNGMINYMDNETGEYVTEADFQGKFYQLLTNGTIQPYTLSPLYSNITLNALIANLRTLAQDELNLNLSLNYSNYKYRVYQTDPWQVSVDMLFEYSLVDSTMSWENRTLFITATVPIYGIRDPLFVLNNAPYTPIIEDTHVISGTWNISQLIAHINSTNYTENNNSPSFLMRFSNVTTNSSYGIESLINPALMGTTASEVNRTFVDYLYWTYPWDCVPLSQNLLEVDSISDVPAYRYFRLDDTHLVRYINSTERLFNTTLMCNS